MQPHRDKPAHVNGNGPIFYGRRRRRRIVHGIGAEDRNAALVQPGNAVGMKPGQWRHLAGGRFVLRLVRVAADRNQQDVALRDRDVLFLFGSVQLGGCHGLYGIDEGFAAQARNVQEHAAA
jgi:hypothetical protein